MKAVLYQGQKQIELTNLDMPIVGNNDSVIKNIYSSICGSDVAVYQHGTGMGHRITLGEEFGHETISKVIQVGKHVKEIQIGDIVYPYPRLAREIRKGQVL